MVGVGYLYQRGLGVPQDDAKAIQWDRPAVAQGGRAAAWARN